MIRSENDRGIAIVLDRRAPTFAKVLPGLAPVGDLAATTYAFYGRRARWSRSATPAPGAVRPPAEAEDDPKTHKWPSCGLGAVIITRTPLRISFAGGGTDLPGFYRAYGGGACTSAAIDRYIHVLVNEKFDKSIRVAYSRTENVDRLDDLQHPIFREAMRVTGVHEALEIHTIADIPSEGTGLGSSSTLTVGLLNALYAYRGVLKDPAELAEEACRIEIDRLGGTLGKQDQYIAAFGGVEHF